MDYIEDDFTDALIDAVCGKLPSTWYTLMKAKTTLIRYM